MFDKLAFGMSKIDGEATSKPGSYGSSSVAKDGSAGSAATTGLGLMDVSSKRADSTEVTAERISNVSLHPSGFNKTTTPHPAHPPGPSLLTQMAPSQPPVTTSSQPHAVPTSKTSVEPNAVDPKLSSSVMSMDSVLAETSTTSSLLESTAKITVKIADLGNGWYLSFYVIVIVFFMAAH
jgi:serine/threonine-protein kinase SRPK3